MKNYVRHFIWMAGVVGWTCLANAQTPAAPAGAKPRSTQLPPLPKGFPQAQAVQVPPQPAEPVVVAQAPTPPAPPPEAKPIQFNRPRRLPPYNVQPPLAPPDQLPPSVLTPPSPPPAPSITIPNVQPGQPVQSVRAAPFTQPPAIQPGAVPADPQATQPAAYLAWDAERKDYKAELTDTNAHFTFWLTNVSKEPVLVHRVRTSCGCTAAQLPETPWSIAPGASGPIKVTMDLRGKRGSVTKAVMVDTTAGGMKNLMVTSIIPEDPNALANMDRTRNIQVALADRQAVFKGDCARCHVEPAKGKQTGAELYAGACAICHDAAHRAAMVPDLRQLPHPTDLAFWTKITSEGKTNSLMPAFAAEHGGYLNKIQVDSLAAFLDKAFPSRPVAAVAPQKPQAGIDPAAPAGK